MHFTPSIFCKLLGPITRRPFRAIVERHNGDFYGKSFGSFDHLVALIFAQFGAASSLRAWRRRGTLAPTRIHGMKMHVLYDPRADCPRIIDITSANINDAQIGRTIPIETGVTYVFDKGYRHYGWWRAIAAAQSGLVTRNKTSRRLDVVQARRIDTPNGKGFTVLRDDEVRFARKGDSKLPIRLRRVTVERHDGGVISLLTNDLERAATDIAGLYKGRWEIELPFRWIKQHLKIRKFLGNNDNAIRLQLFAAMIAYALLRIAARVNRIKLPILRFTDLVAQYLLERRNIAAIERPSPVHPSKPKHTDPHPQISFSYA